MRLFFLAGLAFLCCLADGGVAFSRELIVPDEFSNLQDAIDQAADGDTVRIVSPSFDVLNQPPYIVPGMSMPGEETGGLVIQNKRIRIKADEGVSASIFDNSQGLAYAQDFRDIGYSEVKPFHSTI